jgi:hypothetical protein
VSQFRGQTVWKGQVQVFDLSGHPKAARCYAWSYPEGPSNQDERFVAVLEIPPVVFTVTTLQASIVGGREAREVIFIDSVVGFPGIAHHRQRFSPCRSQFAA